MAFQLIMLFALADPHLVHGLVQQFDDVKTITNNLCRRELRRRTGDKSMLIYSTGFFGRAFAFKVLADVVDGRFVFAFRDMNDPLLIPIDSQGNVLMTFLGGRFIDA